MPPPLQGGPSALPPLARRTLMLTEAALFQFPGGVSGIYVSIFLAMCGVAYMFSGRQDCRKLSAATYSSRAPRWRKTEHVHQMGPNGASVLAFLDAVASLSEKDLCTMLMSERTLLRPTAWMPQFDSATARWLQLQQEGVRNRELGFAYDLLDGLLNSEGPPSKSSLRIQLPVSRAVFAVVYRDLLSANELKALLGQFESFVSATATV